MTSIQLHINPQVKNLIQSMGGQMPDWDGAVILEADSHETLIQVKSLSAFPKSNEKFLIFSFQFGKDRGYEMTIRPDEEKFLDRERTVLIPMDLATVISK